MNPTEITADPTVQEVLKDLIERAERAEARARSVEVDLEAAEARADTEQARADKTAQENEAQEKIIAALMHQIGSLTRRLAKATSRSEQLVLKFELRAAQRRIDELCRDKFGQRSERRGRKGSDTQKKKKAKQTGHGPNPQANLPRDPQLHLLDEADQVCPKCDPARPLEPWEGKTEDSEEITVVERTFRVNLHQRQIYLCGGCGFVETAFGPKRLIPGGRYSPEFAATVATDKYRDHLPLNRQSKRMGEAGLVVTRQTLWDQIEQLYVLLLPSYLALQTRILESEVVYADETSWRFMKKGSTRRWWVWGATDGRRVFFLLAPTRGQAAARELLGDFSGVLMADRYSVYLALEKERTRIGGRQVLMLVDEDEPTAQPGYFNPAVGTRDPAGGAVRMPTPDYTLAACWMHARRGFIKAARHGEAKAEEVLDLIAELYAVEAEAKAEVAQITDRDEREAALIEARRHLRAERSKPIIDTLRGWLDSTLTVPGLPLDKAVNWINNGWRQLTRFLEDPRIPLDNGIAEQAVRGVVLGRRTHAGSRSRDGTQVAAMFYSFVESCRLAEVDVRAYLTEAARRALEDREIAFLPEDFAAMNRDPAPRQEAEIR